MGYRNPNERRPKAWKLSLVWQKKQKGTGDRRLPGGGGLRRAGLLARRKQRGTVARERARPWTPGCRPGVDPASAPPRRGEGERERQSRRQGLSRPGLALQALEVPASVVVRHPPILFKQLAEPLPISGDNTTSQPIRRLFLYSPLHLTHYITTTTPLPRPV